MRRVKRRGGGDCGDVVVVPVVYQVTNDASIEHSVGKAALNNPRRLRWMVRD